MLHSDWLPPHCLRTIPHSTRHFFDSNPATRRLIAYILLLGSARIDGASTPPVNFSVLCLKAGAAPEKAAFWRSVTSE